MVNLNEDFDLFDRAGLTQIRARHRAIVSEGEVDRVAGGVMADCLVSRFPKQRVVLIVVGSGVTGCLARSIGQELAARGYEPIYVTCASDLEAIVLTFDWVLEGWLGSEDDLIIDDESERIIHFLNACTRPVVALDMPLGLDADGRVIGTTAVYARLSLCWRVSAVGCWTGAGCAYSGEVIICGPHIKEPAVACAHVACTDDLRSWVSRRSRNAHKGVAGTLAILGGGPGMPGAVRLAATAAYRVGAGLVGATVHPDHASVLAATFPELITFSPDNHALFLTRSRIVLVGTGLGRDAFGADLWHRSLQVERPLIVDGDALYWLAQSPQQRADWVLTPHEGEAARLLGASVGEISANRLYSVRAIQQRYGGICVLKGAGTLIDDGQSCWLCPYGNSGMATAGMGDVLAGVIAGLAVQGGALGAAARLGVWLHALAGDHAAIRVGRRGLLATDVIGEIPSTLQPLLPVCEN